MEPGSRVLKLAPNSALGMNEWVFDDVRLVPPSSLLDRNLLRPRPLPSNHPLEIHIDTIICFEILV